MLDLVLSRIDGLGEDGRRLLTSAAAIGTRFSATARWPRSPAHDPAGDTGRRRRAAGLAASRTAGRYTLPARPDPRGAAVRAARRRRGAGCTSGSRRCWTAPARPTRRRCTPWPATTPSARPAGPPSGCSPPAGRRPARAGRARRRPTALDFLETGRRGARAGGHRPGRPASTRRSAGRYLRLRPVRRGRDSPGSRALGDRAGPAPPGRACRCGSPSPTGSGGTIDRSIEAGARGPGRAGRPLPRNRLASRAGTLGHLLSVVVAGVPGGRASRPATGERRERLRLAVEPVQRAGHEHVHGPPPGVDGAAAACTRRRLGDRLGPVGGVRQRRMIGFGLAGRDAAAAPAARPAATARPPPSPRRSATRADRPRRLRLGGDRVRHRRRGRGPSLVRVARGAPALARSGRLPQRRVHALHGAGRPRADAEPALVRPCTRTASAPASAEGAALPSAVAIAGLLGRADARPAGRRRRELLADHTRTRSTQATDQLPRSPRRVCAGGAGRAGRAVRGGGRGVRGGPELPARHDRRSSGSSSPTRRSAGWRSPARPDATSGPAAWPRRRGGAPARPGGQRRAARAYHGWPAPTWRCCPGARRGAARCSPAPNAVICAARRAAARATRRPGSGPGPCAAGPRVGRRTAGPVRPRAGRRARLGRTGPAGSGRSSAIDGAVGRCASTGLSRQTSRRRQRPLPRPAGRPAAGQPRRGDRAGPAGAGPGRAGRDAPHPGRRARVPVPGRRRRPARCRSVGPRRATGEDLRRADRLQHHAGRPGRRDPARRSW